MRMVWTAHAWRRAARILTWSAMLPTLPVPVGMRLRRAWRSVYDVRLVLEVSGRLMRRLFDFSAFGDIPVAAISVRREYIDAHRSAVQKFVDGLVQSLAGMKANRVATLALMKSTFAIDADAALSAAYQ